MRAFGIALALVVGIFPLIWWYIVRTTYEWHAMSPLERGMPMSLLMVFPLIMVYGIWSCSRVTRGNLLLPMLTRSLFALGDMEHAAALKETADELRAASTCKWYALEAREYAGKTAGLIEEHLNGSSVLPIPAEPLALETAQLPRSVGAIEAGA